MKKGMVGNIIGLVIGLILVLAVLLPTTISIMQSQNATVFGISTTAWTVMNLLPLFIVLLGLVAIAGYMIGGRK